MRTTLLCSHCLLLAWPVAAQPHLAAEFTEAAPAPGGYVARSWVTDDGLPHNVVLRIEQDRVGYLWLATMAGLARFDGLEFKIYPVPGRPAARGRNVRDFALQSDGTVLFLPATGGVMQVKDDVVAPHPLSRLVGTESLLKIYAEPGGAIWLATAQGVVRWEHDRLERFAEADGINRRTLNISWATDGRGRTWIAGADFLGYYAAGKLVRVEAPAGAVYRIAPSRTGGIWAYGNSLFKWEDERLMLVAPPAWPPERASARGLFEDPTGVLWIATSRAGLFRFDGQQIAAVPNVESAVEFITADTEGDIWLGTEGGGICRLRTKSFTLVDGPVTTVSAEANGAVWLAAMSSGLIRFDGQAPEIFPLRIGQIPLHAMTATADGARRVWIATTVGLFQASVEAPGRLRRIDPTVRNANLLFAARNGDVWLAAPDRFGYFRGDTFTSRLAALGAGETVTAMAEQPDGPVWLGTARGNLYVATDGAIARAPVPSAATGGHIHALFPEKSGALWLGTTDGLVWVEGTRVRRFTTADGLPDDGMLQLLEDATGDVWLATPRGLFRLPRADLLARIRGESTLINAVAYGPEQGLTGISPTTNQQPAACVDRRGVLWFNTYKGAIGIDPARVQHDSIAPPVLIQEVRLDEQRVAGATALRVPAGEHRLEFRFAALSFAAPQHVRLRHQLEGFDTAWVDTAPDRVTRYAKLPPGSYRLRVIACNSEGVWNRRGAEFAFVVLPAWWQTLWFRSAAVLGFAALVGGVGRHWAHRKFRARLERLEREHALERERSRIARDMHDELGGTVTGINLAVQRLRAMPGVEPNGLVEVLDRRVRRLTVELERVVWTVSPHHGSLEQLASYVERFARNLIADSAVACRLQRRDAIPARPVSPEVQHHVLAVTKEAINNALKHAHAATIVVELGFRDDVFSVLIHDDGVGIAMDSYPERNGLRNMQVRMTEIGAKFVLQTKPNAGTTVAFHVPLTRAAPH